MLLSFGWWNAGILILILAATATATATDLASEVGNVLASVGAANGSVIVLPLRHLGLGNRLRVIAGIQSIALDSRRKLVVLWSPSDECNATFHALFAPLRHPTVVVHDLLFPAGTDNALSAAVSAFADAHGQAVAVAKPRDFHEKFLAAPPAGIVLMWTLGVHAPFGLPCADHMHMKSAFYRALQPAPAVRARMAVVSTGPAAASAEGGFYGATGRVVGVHVRAYDSTYDWAVVAPPTGSGRTHAETTGAGAGAGAGGARALRFDEASPLEAFTAVMAQIQQSFPTTKFFVASNSASAKTALRQRFGEHAVLTAWDGDGEGDSEGDTAADAVDGGPRGRSTAAGMAAAAADFFLLSQCAFVVHSKGSSFAAEAAAVHNRPVVDVSVDAPPAVAGTGAAAVLTVLSHDVSLPYCGLHEYIRVDANRVLHSESIGNDDGVCVDSCARRAPVCYDEAGERSMCTQAFRACPCEAPYRRLTGLPALLCPREDNGVRLGADAGEGCVTVLADSNGYSLSF